MAAMTASRLGAYGPGGAVIAAEVTRADDYDSRTRGLLGRDSMKAGEGLLLSLPLWWVPCPTIHMFFMRFPIDAVFLDGENRVVLVLEALKPWRLSPWVPRARACLELPAGAVGGRLKKGDVVSFRAVEPPR